ncbi:16S rRNA (cytosine(1402)-N(4))-methyltransferase RsmH [Chthonobacter rhizosphaerae]|uniref:16S rRNA (cytosine(1402)-N(4))-methyltransferase RsmH n=1 Tax=Chthonobacter rhizosphaerae TaxID=2735553 RepID=UPI0015EEEBD6|nr:16S rRNA (cytosine(1402)-N(4))-methyltransferase RsmH [Chthonobacter rhizosphaerae]
MTAQTPVPAPHIPVLLDEVLSALRPIEGGVFVDGTFGAGGYTRALLGAGARTVIAIDRDPTAIAAGAALVTESGGRLKLVHGTFSELDAHAEASGHPAVDGVVLDIGVSSMQLDEAERGFSFRQDGPLDMRMSLDGPSAADVVNEMDGRDIALILKLYGEERQAGRIARAIVAARGTAPLTRTRDLVQVCEKVLGAKRFGEAHPATRTFQAIRIYVNRELDQLVEALAAAERLLPEGGRLAVVTFHSLEDRIVKRFVQDRSRTVAQGSRHLPEAMVPPATFRLIEKGAVEPSEAECARNPRARSARLRTAVRTAAAPRPVDGRALGLPDVELSDRRAGA